MDRAIGKKGLILLDPFVERVGEVRDKLREEEEEEEGRREFRVVGGKHYLFKLMSARQ